MKYCTLLFCNSYTKNIYIYIYGIHKDKFLTPPLRVLPGTFGLFRIEYPLLNGFDYPY